MSMQGLAKRPRLEDAQPCKSSATLSTPSSPDAADPHHVVPPHDPSAAPSPTPEADLGDLAEFILKGPLLATCGLSEASVRAHLATWSSLGQRLAAQMGMDHATLDGSQRLRIYQYYLPVFFWVEAQLDAHRAAAKARGEPPAALVLGISAPQGCGKSTLVEQLEALFNALGRRTAGVSVDDFYLTFADQSALAQEHPGNRLLQYRGNAGTHDLQLGSDTLTSLRALTQAGQSAPVPRYDKSQQGGRGDRAAAATWPSVEGPLELLLLEGWMTGFAAVPQAQAEAVDPALGEVNRRLQAYPEAWDRWVDSWLVIRIGDPEWVFKWRLQAEVAMMAKGRPGMTEAQVSDFVDRFMPAYRAYLPGLYAEGPAGAKTASTLVIEVDASRAPVLVQPAPLQLAH